MQDPTWWAVALSESVTGDKPLAVVCDQEELVLFRDASGVALALEDRCPHRRVPLSLGCVKPNGLQCAYHGWTFDGSTGACTAIPNLSETEQVPARYGARAFHVAEASGFVYAWLGPDAPAVAPPDDRPQAPEREVTGSAVLPIDFDEYLAAMLDGPQVLLGFDGILVTDFYLGDPNREQDHLILDRGAVWKGKLPPPAFVTDHPLIVRTAVPLAGGSITVELLTADERPLATVRISAVAHRRGTTGVCWRGREHANHLAGAPLRWRAARAMGIPLIRMFTTLDGKAFADLLTGPSEELRTVRSEQPAVLRLAG